MSPANILASTTSSINSRSRHSPSPPIPLSAARGAGLAASRDAIICVWIATRRRCGPVIHGPSLSTRREICSECVEDSGLRACPENYSLFGISHAVLSRDKRAELNSGWLLAKPYLHSCFGGRIPWATMRRICVESMIRKGADRWNRESGVLAQLNAFAATAQFDLPA
jgi:hypothetical protein